MLVARADQRPARIASPQFRQFFAKGLRSPRPAPNWLPHRGQRRNRLQIHTRLAITSTGKISPIGIGAQVESRTMPTTPAASRIPAIATNRSAMRRRARRRTQAAG